ncbi:lysosome-associated membrane glycoprotein 1 [Bombus impatiens]|uniref:Lysosome-associated membrane glycoprotein 5 n=1 Tax=Bombus impatiens TaxID=132113 RepID=A0A6P8L6W4_BOMIM|nr:lysosome-associated membrane glycoprotein 1 [Bombus impatiens]
MYTLGDPFNATSDTDLRLFVTSVTDGIYKCGEGEEVKVGNATIKIKNVFLIEFYNNSDISAPKEELCSGQKQTPTFPYVLRDKNSIVCTLAKMSISLKIPYRKNNTQYDTAIIEVPTTLNVSGTCDSSRGTSTMILNWNSEVSKTESTFANEKTNTIVLHSQRDDIDSHVSVITANIFIDTTHFNDAQNVGEVIQMVAPFKNLFSAPAKNGIHSCPEKVFTTIGGITVTMRNVLLVAFDAQQDFASKQVTDCRSVYFERDFTYIVRRNDTGIPCTLARMSIDATVLYKKVNLQNNRTLNVPSTAVVSGNCSNKSSEMTLSWSESDKNNTMNTITFHIGKNETNFFVYQVAATVYYNKDDKTTAIQGESYNMQDLFSASGNNGLYNCTSLIHEIKIDDIYLKITNVTFIAFNTETYLSSKTVTQCSTNSGGDTPIPSVTGYSYVVTNKENVPCIAANMSISIKVPYIIKNTSTTNQTTLIVPIGKQVNVNGTCENEKSIMNLIWTENPKANSQYENKENKVTFNFVNDSSNYFIRSMNLSIYLDDYNFPGANATGSYINVITENIDIFSTPLNNVYKCSDKTSVNAQNVVITISKVSLIAFNKARNITSRSVNCANNESTDSNVGAIVGGIVGGIILVGIIGYLGVTYKRNRGYGV